MSDQLLDFDNLQHKQNEQNIAIDFDGVIHANSKGFFDGTVYDEPMPGVKQALSTLYAMGYSIIIFTAKARKDRILINGKPGKELVWDWLELHDLSQYVTSVTSEKPRAKCYIDDKGIRFTSWRDTLPEVLSMLKRPNSGRVGVDVGAASFPSGNRLYKETDFVMLFEPQLEPYLLLEEKYKGNDKVLVFREALGEKEGTFPLYVLGKANCSSFLEPDPSHPVVYERGSDFKVNALSNQYVNTLTSAVRFIYPGVLDWVKLDTQGTEYEILLGGEEVIKNTKRIQCEVEFTPVYKNQKLYKDIRDLLESWDFELERLDKTSDWHGDAFFKNKRFT